MPRPCLKPTESQRNLAKSMAACGIQQEDIARRIGIRSPKTLRKYFSQELSDGSTDANYNVATSLYKRALAGDTNAAKFWLGCRAGWRDPSNFVAPVAPPPFIVAKERTEGQI